MTAAASTPRTPQHPQNGGNIVIVGNGQAGIQAADSLRGEGFTGRITIIGGEYRTPYQRPPLSKDYLDPDKVPAPLPLRGESFFADPSLDHRPGVTATGIDRSGKTVTLSDGTELAYSKLILATGAANRQLTVPGAELSGIHRLRTLGDAEALAAELGAAANVVVVGAGFIGLEFAAAARRHNLAVTVLEFADRPLSRALTAEMSSYLVGAHRANGVELRLGEGIASFEAGADGRVACAVSSRGQRYEADLVLIGVGVIPQTEIARCAGLEVENGICVDHTLTTADADIHAIGDCAAFPSSYTGGRIRLESVQNATDHARHVAKTILEKHEPGQEAYADLPWFWSSQGSLRLQIAGLSAPQDQIVLRGNPGDRKFSVFCYRGGRLAAVESLNQPAEHMAARRILSAGRSLDPTKAADPAFDLKTYSKVPEAAGVS